MNEINANLKPRCRFCQNVLEHTFIDLGMQPLCEEYVKPEELNKMEPHYPLHVYICDRCFLVQLEEFVAPSEIYDNYAYFSSYSDSWLQHAKKYTDLMVRKFQLNKNSFVAEIASNDGYLLQWFKEKNIPVLGIDPAANIAEYAMEKKNIRTEVRFFGVETAEYLKKKYGQPDLLLGNNVLAHVPDINDFVKGMKIFLKSGGVITMEFPHLQRLIEENQFDTIYHEHFSYLSFVTVSEIFEFHGLKLFDVEELSTHGGSIRIYAKHIDDNTKVVTERAKELIKREQTIGLKDLEYYANFEENVKETKRKILEFLIEAKRNGKQVAGYGAPGKGNTLLNYCGVRTDFIDYTVDRNPHKHNHYLPGTLIPIFDPIKIKETKPDYVIILPWNLKEEIVKQLQYIKEWGGKFVIPIPELQILN
jgi:2-polyprenyl-3-methyl-5-hydroxy-6-metoxy-1,4-benzoquinol methylase